MFYIAFLLSNEFCKRALESLISSATEVHIHLDINIAQTGRPHKIGIATLLFAIEVCGLF